MKISHMGKTNLQRFHHELDFVFVPNSQFMVSLKSNGQLKREADS